MHKIFQRTRHPQHDWLERFGARLMRLNPRLKPLDAMQEAVTVYPDAADLDPEEAAEIFALQ